MSRSAVTDTSTTPARCRRSKTRSGRTRPASPASSRPSITSASASATSTRRSSSSSSPGSSRSSCARSSPQPNAHVLGPETYNELFTMHGTTMIFLFNTPVLAGFGNYLLPLQIGTRDMAFPRLNAFSYWIFLLAGHLPLLELPRRARRPTAAGSRYTPLTDKAVLARHQPRLLGPRRRLRRHLHDGRRGQLHRHHLQDARARA